MPSYEYHAVRLLADGESLFEAPGGGDGIRVLNTFGADGWAVAALCPEHGRSDSYVVILRRETSP